MKKYVCEKCRKPVALSDKFCGYCGAEFINDDAKRPATRDKGKFYEKPTYGRLELTPSVTPKQILEWEERGDDLNDSQHKPSIDFEASQEELDVIEEIRKAAPERVGLSLVPQFRENHDLVVYTIDPEMQMDFSEYGGKARYVEDYGIPKEYGTVLVNLLARTFFVAYCENVSTERKVVKFFEKLGFIEE